MSDVQIAVIDQQDTQIVLAVPGVQGATGSSIPSGGTTDQVLRKNSSTDYDANWAQVTSAMIANGTIVNDDINNSAAIAGTKISPDFGGQAVTTTGQVSAARVNVTNNTPPSNGIYLPSANNVAISTGGSGRLFIGANPHVGVGITPNASSASSQVLEVGPSTFSSINNDCYQGANWFYTGAAYVYKNSAAASQYIQGGGAHIWTTASSGTAGNAITFSERLRITSTGTVNIVGAGSAGSTQAVSFNGSAPINSLVLTSGGLLGVGTSSPDRLLHVNASGGNQLLVRSASTDNIGGAQTPYMQIDSSGGYTGAGSVTGLLVDISADSTTNKYAAIFNGGRVGIGTSSPGAPLDVVTGSSGAIFRFSTASTNLQIIPEAANGNVGIRFAANSGAAPNLQFRNDAGSNLVTITNGGNVGIGTTQLYGILTARAATNCNFHIRTPSDVGSSGEGVAIDSLSDNAGGVRPLVMRATSHVFFGESTERARIDSSGRLLVGTSTARDKFFNTSGQQTLFQVERVGLSGTQSYQTASFITNSEDGVGAYVTLGASRGTAVNSYTPLQSDDVIGKVAFQGADGTELVSAAEITAFVDGAPGANDMPGRLVFSTTSDGQASPTPRLTITSTGQVRLAGAGITFNGDTATANELDDYEEGTWTPTIAGQTTTGTGTYSVQSGRYTKVGRSVYVAGTVAWSAHDGTGNMRIAGLPFTALNVTELANAVSFTYVSDITIPANSIPIGGVFPNSTFVTLYSMAVAGGTPNGLGMDGSGTIYFSLTYQTA